MPLLYITSLAINFLVRNASLREAVDGGCIGILALLIGLELVLGVDNVLVIAIFVGRLPEGQRQKARMLGLSLAMVARILMLVVVLALTSLTQPVISNLSVRDLILLAGGLFLLFKAVHEIHNTVEFCDVEPGPQEKQPVRLLPLLRRSFCWTLFSPSIR